jgi:hypothetical protein
MPPNRTRPHLLRVFLSAAEFAQVRERSTGNMSEYARRKIMAEDGPGEVAKLRAQLDSLRFRVERFIEDTCREQENQ